MAGESVARRILRWTLRGVAALAALVLVVLGIFAVINWHDEPLQPEARAVIDGSALQAPAPADNLFFTIIGFSSAEGDDLNAEGQRVFALYQKAPAPTTDSPDPFDIYRIAGVHRIKLSGDKLALCGFGMDEKPYRCIVDAQAHKDSWQKMLADNAALLERYRRLPVSGQYLNLMSPGPLTPMLSWSDLFDGKRLLISALALQIDSGDANGAIDVVAADITRWRNFLGLRNLMLIDKMIAAAQLRIDLLFASEALRTRPLDAAHYDALEKVLAPLSANERSMHGPMEGETRFTAATLAKAQHAWDAASMTESTGVSDWMLSRLSDLGYQRNATLNLFYRQNENMALQGDQSCTGFQAFREQSNQGLNFSFKDYWVNPSGKILVAIGTPAVADYVGRLCDLDGILRIVSLQLNIHRSGISHDQIPAYLQKAGSQFADPYSGQPMEWHPDSSGLSFPATDKRNKGQMPWPI